MFSCFQAVLTKGVNVQDLNFFVEEIFRCLNSDCGGFRITVGLERAALIRAPVKRTESAPQTTFLSVCDG